MCWQNFEHNRYNWELEQNTGITGNILGMIVEFMPGLMGLFNVLLLVEWWKAHEPDIPTWADAYKLILLVQLSSAAAERVFSLIVAKFNQYSVVSSTGLWRTL